MQNTKTHAEMAEVASEIEKLQQEVRIRHAAFLSKQDELNILVREYRTWCKKELESLSETYL